MNLSEMAASARAVEQRKEEAKEDEVLSGKRVDAWKKDADAADDKQKERLMFFGVMKARHPSWEGAPDIEGAQAHRVSQRLLNASRQLPPHRTVLDVTWRGFHSIPRHSIP